MQFNGINSNGGINGFFPYNAVIPVFKSSYESYRTLPDEVKESLEAHKNELRTEDDIKHFLHEQELRQ